MQDIKPSVCPQCQNIPSGASARLVTDACGHTKCRTCLLSDTNYCKQCLPSLNSRISTSHRNPTVNGNTTTSETTTTTNNHTAVICNGKLNINAENRLNERHEEETKTFQELKPAPMESSTINVPVDNVTFNNSNSLDKKSFSMPPHIEIQSDPICYLCTICKKTFFTKGHVKYHKYCNGEMKPFSCENCNKSFVLKSQYQAHMWKHKNVKPFKCDKCPKSFSEKSKLARHSALHWSTKDYICPQCGKSFKIQDSLRIHSLIHKNEKRFACTQCPAKFNNSSNLKKHIVSHSSEKVHMCDVCGQTFKLKWSLSVHRKSHDTARPHVCTTCSKAFVHFKDLQRHALIHSDVKQFSCSLCNAAFRRKDILRRHMKNTHPGKKGDIIKLPVTVSEMPKISVVIDNPNAVNVITASPAIVKREGPLPAAAAPLRPTSPISTTSTTTTTTDSRPTVSVISEPIKLAFKTPAFKSNDNNTGRGDLITCAPFAKDQWMNGDDDIPERNQDADIPSQSASYVPSSLHYETSFQNTQHAMIKNIKFKVPAKYTNALKTQAKEKSDMCNSGTLNNSGCEEDEPDFNLSTSVIVNSKSLITNGSKDLHWRRRTFQNLVLKD